MAELNKNIVKKRFDRNIDTYWNKAVVQKKIAERFCDILSELNLNEIKNVLEIGCGTGFLTQQILKKHEFQNYYLNDLSTFLYPKLEQILLKNKGFSYKYLSGDAEQIPFPDNLDAIISTSTVQWFHKLDNFIEKVNTHLPRQGMFAFSTFGEQNFIEIKKTLNIGLEYYSQNQLKKKLTKFFDVVYSEQWTEKLLFDSPKDVLRHIKTTGVNGVKEFCWTKKKLLDFTALYEQNFNVDEKFSLTYQPIIFIVKKA